MSELATHVISYIDTHSRTAGTHTNFTHLVNIPSINHFDSVCVLQAYIPKSFYLITPNSNTFMLNEYGHLPVIVTIPIGNYNRRSFGLKLVSLLNAASPSGFFYNVAVPNTTNEPDTGKYLYTVQTSSIDPTVPVNLPSIEFTTGFQPCESMGFEPLSSNVFSSSGELYSTNVCRLQAKSSIFIKSNCVDNGGTGVLQAIFGADPDFSVINFQVGNAGGIAANRKELINNKTNSFSFAITDEDDFVLDTNGLSITFSMLMWDSTKYVLYKTPTQPEPK